MGEVYRARDTRLDRTVAIKFTAAPFSDRFEREARAVAALNHTNICTLYDVGPNYLVMELVEGEPLTGPLPLDRVLQFASQILSALDAAHRKGITHRDLKPDNILVTRQGIKLLDFGLAKLQDGHAAPVAPRNSARATAESSTIAQPLTGEHTILGTLQYMSPEQAQGKPVDARSDLFSFGLVLYEMLTGKRAFDGTTPASVIAAIVERNAPSVAGVAPPVLDRVLQKCLAKDPDARWQSARDVQHALDLVQDAPAAAESKAATRWGLAAASLVGFAVASAIGAAWWATRSQPVTESRSLSFRLTPPSGTDFQFTTTSGGSAIAPDGRSVAFVAVSNGSPRLWIRSMDSLEARELQDTDGARFPFWSPDSRAIGFFAGGDLRRVDVSGAVSTLARAPEPRGGAWNTDGTIVFSPNNVGPLQRVSATGGTPSPLTTRAKDDASHRWPEFLPDGRTLLFYIQSDAPGVYVTTLDRPTETKRLVESSSNATYFAQPGSRQGYLLWVERDTAVAQRFDPVSAQLIGPVLTVAGTQNVASFPGANHAALSVSRDGTLLYNTGGTRFQLRWFSPDGAPLTTVGSVDRYAGLQLSPNQTEVLASIDDVSLKRNLWIIDLSSGDRTRVTSGGGAYGAWAPNGQQVVFSALISRNLMSASVRGNDESEALWTANTQIYVTHVSRDGQRVAYVSADPETGYDIWQLGLTGARQPTLVLRSSFGEYHPQYSPDGRWLAYTSTESGREDVFVGTLPNLGDRQKASVGGGSYPRWGRDGHTLYYRAHVGDRRRAGGCHDQPAERHGRVKGVT